MKNAQLKSSISPRELYVLLKGGSPADLLDVRTPVEHAAVHVPGVQLLPFEELDAAAFLKGRGNNDRPLYVFCQLGGRAGRAIEKLHRAGFDNCVLVEGGTQAWIDAGLPVNRSEKRLFPLMRQVQIAVGLVSATGAALSLFVNKWFAMVPLVTGVGLLFAGITGFCGLALLLARMPWNQCPASPNGNEAGHQA